MSGHPVLFLSHSGADTLTAHDLKRRLLASPDANAAGLEVWLDKDDLAPGHGWQEQLEHVIMAGSTAFAVVVGTKGVINWVEREVRVALSRATGDKSYAFIPVFASQGAPSSLPPFASEFHGVFDPLNDERELAKLLRAVLGDAGEDGAGRRQPVRLTGAPFVGLRAMTEADADRFFGREDELDALVETLRANRLVAIVADSGSGKSSLAQAGLIPRIRGGVLEDTGREAPDGRAWQVAVMRPGSDPVEGLRRGVTEAAERLGLDGATRASLRQRIDPARSDPGARVEWVYALQCDLPAAATATVLIVDQFEELLTQTPQEKRQPFIDWLMEITSDTAAIPIRVLLTIRADYFNLCSAHAAFYQRIKPDGHAQDRRDVSSSARRSPNFRLKGMTTAGKDTPGRTGLKPYVGLAAIVHRPLILAGHNDEAEREALLAAIRQDVSDRPGDLALVQMALHEMWLESKSGQENLVEAYSRAGGVAGALAHAAEEVRTHKLDENEAGLLEATLVRLVNLGETGGATRRAARRDEFDPARGKLAEKLTTNDYGRLLLTNGDTFEICHEQLITQWPWWQNCLSAAAAEVRWLARLMVRAAEWSSNGRTRRYLATRAELVPFNRLVAQRRRWLSDPEMSFVGITALWARTLQFARYAAVFGLVIIASVMIYLTYAANEARHQAVANESRALAALSDAAVLGANSHDAIKLALAAWPRSPSDSRPRLRRNMEALSQAMARPLAVLPDMKHDADVRGARFDKAGGRILSWSADGTVRLWDAATGQLRTEMPHGGWVYGALFDEGDARVLSWSENGAVRLWDAATGQPRGALMKHDGAVRGAMFDKSEGRILSWSQDQTVRQWDVATGQPRGALMKHGGAVFGAVYDQSEDRIISWSEDGTVRLWDAATGQPRGAAMKHGSVLRGARFNKAEDRILSWSEDGALRLWDGATGQPVGAAMKDEGGVWGALFDQAEEHILSWSTEGNVSLWDAATGQRRGVAMKHGGLVRGARFNKAENRILSWSEDGTLRLWDVATGQALVEMQHGGLVLDALFDRMEERILSWSWDGTLRLWDAATWLPRGAPMWRDGRLNGALFDQSQDRILSWWSDGTVRLWDAMTGQTLGAVMLHEAPVLDAHFDQAEDRVVSWSFDGTVRLWDAMTGHPRGAPMTHDHLQGAFFDKAQGRVLSWSPDGIVRLWDAASGQPIGGPMEIKHDGPVHGVHLAKGRILSWSDRTAYLWDAASGRPIGAPKKHDDTVIGARFVQADSRILSWSRDDMRLWDAATGQPIDVPMARDGQSFMLDDAEKRILWWSGDGTMRLRDVATGQLIGAPMKHDRLVLGARFNKAQDRILSWSDDKTMRLWDAATGQPIGAPMEHEASVQGALFDHAEVRILSWSPETMRLWDAATRRPIGAPMKLAGIVRGALFDRADGRILSWSEPVYGTVQLWDAATGQPVGPPMMHGRAVRGARFNEAESRVLSWSSDNTIRLWDVSRLMHGNVIELACRLLADKGISTLERDYGIKVTDPICTDGGRDAPAPSVSILRE